VRRWIRFWKWGEVAQDLRTTPIGEQGLYIDHWRGCVRIRRGEQSIVITREEIDIMTALADGKTPEPAAQGSQARSAPPSSEGPNPDFQNGNNHRGAPGGRET
jgi:hypothetical protein